MWGSLTKTGRKMAGTASKATSAMAGTASKASSALGRTFFPSRSIGEKGKPPLQGRIIEKPTGVGSQPSLGLRDDRSTAPTQPVPGHIVDPVASANPTSPLTDTAPSPFPAPALRKPSPSYKTNPVPPFFIGQEGDTRMRVYIPIQGLGSYSQHRYPLSGGCPMVCGMVHPALVLGCRPSSWCHLPVL